jgi:hypothetical protein
MDLALVVLVNRFVIEKRRATENTEMQIAVFAFG